MEEFSNSELADTHLACRAVDCNAFVHMCIVSGTSLKDSYMILLEEGLPELLYEQSIQQP